MSTPPRRFPREGLRDTPARREHAARQLLFETAQEEELVERLQELGQITPPQTSPPARMDDEVEVGQRVGAAAPPPPARKDPLNFNTSVVCDKLIAWAAQLKIGQDKGT